MKETTIAPMPAAPSIVTLPGHECGKMSPYPTVVIVIKHK